MQAKYTAAIGPNMNPDTRVFSPQVMTGKWWVENGPSKMEVLTENKTSGWWMLVVYLPLWKIWVSSSVGMIFHSQLFLESLIKFHGSSHHQMIFLASCRSIFLGKLQNTNQQRPLPPNTQRRSADLPPAAPALDPGPGHGGSFTEQLRISWEQTNRLYGYETMVIIYI